MFCVALSFLALHDLDHLYTNLSEQEQKHIRKLRIYSFNHYTYTCSQTKHTQMVSDHIQKTNINKACGCFKHLIAITPFSMFAICSVCSLSWLTSTWHSAMLSWVCIQSCTYRCIFKSRTFAFVLLSDKPYHVTCFLLVMSGLLSSQDFVYEK